VVISLQIRVNHCIASQNGIKLISCFMYLMPSSWASKIHPMMRSLLCMCLVVLRVARWDVLADELSCLPV
jgi:hypothetical protein